MQSYLNLYKDNMVSSKNRNVAIDFCRTVATLMVINSHMAICYPSGFQVFATGGGLVMPCFSFVQASHFF